MQTQPAIETETNPTPIDSALLATEEVKSKVRGNPRCGRANCFGRGWTGYVITRKADGEIHIQLQLCSCVQQVETEYSRLSKRFEEDTTAMGILLCDEIKAGIKTIISFHENQMNGHFTNLHHRELGWKISNFFYYLKNKCSKLHS